MKTCAIMCSALIKIRRIITSKVCYCNWLQVISQKIEKTSDENYAWMFLLFFTLWSVVLRLSDVSNKYFKYIEMGSMPPVLMALGMGDFLKFFRKIAIFNAI